MGSTKIPQPIAAKERKNNIQCIKTFQDEIDSAGDDMAVLNKKLAQHAEFHSEAPKNVSLSKVAAMNDIKADDIISWKGQLIYLGEKENYKGRKELGNRCTDKEYHGAVIVKIVQARKGKNKNSGRVGIVTPHDNGYQEQGIKQLIKYVHFICYIIHNLVIW